MSKDCKKDIRRMTLFIALICLFFALLFFSFFDLRVYAGDINANEARVIAVASGTFTYKGRIYRAYSSYINQLYSTLSDDDFDLSSEQADTAISYIYENVKEGIDSGYIYEVDAPDENNVDVEQELEQIEEEKKDTHNEAAKKASDKEVEQVFDNVEQKHKENQTTSSRVAATESDASIIISDDGIVIETSDSDIVIRKDERIIPVYMCLGLVLVSAICLAVNIIVFIVLSLNKCIRIKKLERTAARKGHRRRRKIRKHCRRFITVSLAVSIAMICLIIAISIGLFNDNKIMQNIQTSGYFRYSYTEYIADCIEAEKTIIPYEDYILREKLKIDAILRNGNIIEMDSISSEDKLSENENLTTASGDETSADRSIAPYIRRMQIDIKKSLIITAVLSSLAILLGAFCDIYMDLRRDRGVKSIAISVFIGTVFTWCIVAALALLHIENRVFIEPDYLYSFFTDQMNWILKVLIIIGIFGAALGLAFFGTYKGMRKDRG